MMHHEFEQIAGYEVSYSDYVNYIEPMYMAMPESISKQEFVKMIDKKRFALKPIKNIVKEMKELAKDLKDTCTHYTDYERKEKLEALVREYMERKGYSEAFDYYIEECELFTCYYPSKIKIYSKKTYKNIEGIIL